MTDSSNSGRETAPEIELNANYPNGTAFLNSYEQAGNGSFALPTAPAQTVMPGARVAIRVTIIDRQMDFRVICRMAQGTNALRVNIEPGQEVARDLILACARNEEMPSQRRKSPRIPYMVKVNVRDERGKVVEAITIDISDHGIRVVGVMNPPIGSQLNIQIRTWAFLLPWPVRLLGKVISNHHISSGRHAFGVALEFESDRQKSAWERFVGRAKSDAWSGDKARSA
jgi:hypothetical protein